VRKTLRRSGKTLEHGVFRVTETVYFCARRCTTTGSTVDGGNTTTAVMQRSAALARLLMPRRQVGYDIMAWAGRKRWVEYEQRDDIQEALKDRFGIELSTGEISTLTHDFLVYLKALHDKRAPELRATLEKDGGWPMHIDATGEAGRGTLLVVYAGWRHWVLGSWKIPSENADAILPKLRTIQAHFGTPCGIMHDLGKAVIEASRDFIGELGQPIPDLVCHFHLVKDVGRDLMGEAQEELRARFRSNDVCAHLRAMARDLGQRLGTDILPARQDVEDWMAIVDCHHRLPSGRRAGIGSVRAICQWVLDFADDGTGEGFPFDVPLLDLFERCRKACRALEGFLCDPPDDAKVHGYLKRLHRIVVATRRPDFAHPVAILQQRRELLGEFRTALRVEVKAHLHAMNPAAATAGPATPDSLLEDREVKVALEDLVLSLRERRPERGPAKDARDAIDIVLAHIERHRRSLWGHAVLLPSELGGGVRLIERTNIVLEHFFGLGKRGERRRSGRKNLAADLEQIPGAAALAANLTCPDYVEILCGRIEDLPKAFAELDAGNRTVALPVLNAAAEKSADADVVRASLPKADRKIIRSARLLAKIDAAARSRAPRHADPHATAGAR
jgi:hypothetical protein